VTFLPVCFFCGDTEIVGSQEKIMADLMAQYSIDRPLCEGCVAAGKTPAVRNALKRNK